MFRKETLLAKLEKANQEKQHSLFPDAK